MPANNLSGAPPLPFLSESVHIIMFAVLAWLLIRDQKKSSKDISSVKRIYIMAIVTSLFCGILIEFLQEVTGLGRKAEFKDVLFDLCGILISIGVIIILSRKKIRSKTKG